MGIDMYFTKRLYVGAEYEHRNVKGSIEITVNDEPLSVNFGRVSYIEERAGYWRKANAIHAWFVANVQDGKDDCGDYEVSVKDMEKLLAVVNEVLADHGKAPKLLPTQDGFFFGGTEYDEYYFADLRETKTILENALADNKGDYYYHSSW